MPLSLRRNPASAPARRKTDHLVMNGQLKVGRIYQRDTPDQSDSQWLWAINGVQLANPTSCESRVSRRPLIKPGLSRKTTGRSDLLGPISKKSSKNSASENSAARLSLSPRRPALTTSAAAVIPLRPSLSLHQRPLQTTAALSRCSLSLRRQALIWLSQRLKVRRV